MKDYFKIPFVLTLVCIICAFFLSYTYGIASDKIESNATQKISNSISQIATNIKTVEEEVVEGQVIYKLFDNNNALIGYAFLAEGQGYQGKIKILAVVNINFDKLIGIEIVDSIETPGLGAKIQEDDFKNQFKAMIPSKKIQCTKSAPDGNNQIQAITGATISSQAVVNILNKKISHIKNILKK